MEEYYIGVDIGDGETSVAMLTEHMVAPVTLPLGYANHSILSAVGLLVPKQNSVQPGIPLPPNMQPQIIIGDNVQLLANVKERRVRFKSQFLSGKVNEDVRRFAKGLHQAIQQYSGISSDSSRIHYVLGCPNGAKWTDDQREAYAAVVGKELPVAKIPIGESRAAFLYTHYRGALDVSPEMLKGSVLVVDMGSSTTDLAYVVAGKDKTQTMKEFGEAFLGGGMIDEAILDYAIEHNNYCEQIKAFFQRVPTARTCCELVARKVKEQYFTALSKNAPAEFVQSEVVYYGTTAAMKTSLKIKANKKIIDYVLNLRKPVEQKKNAENAENAANNEPQETLPSFLETLDELLKQAVELTKDEPPKLIILTGGASRMNFVRKHIQQHFPDAFISACDEPEFSIAKGLAFACRVDHRMGLLRKEVSDHTENIAFDIELDQYLAPLVRQLADKIVPEYINRLFLPAAKKHVGAKALQTALEEQAKAFFEQEDMKELIRKEIALWMENAMPELKGKIIASCQKYRVEDTTMPIPKAEKLTITMPPIPINIVVNLLMAIPGVGNAVAFMMEDHYVETAKAELQNEMLNRASTFYTKFRAEMKKSIINEINARAEKVEIPIV